MIHDFPGGLVVKNQLANAGNIRDVGSLCGSGRSPEGHGTPVSCLENPLDEKSGGLQSIGSQRVGHGWSNLACMHSWLRLQIHSMERVPSRVKKNWESLLSQYTISAKWSLPLCKFSFKIPTANNSWKQAPLYQTQQHYFNILNAIKESTTT